MEALIIGLLGLVGSLVQKGAQAYADAQKQHDELIAAVESGLSDAQMALARMKSDHDVRMADARKKIADLAEEAKAHASSER